jgi:hypothetical protein
MNTGLDIRIQGGQGHFGLGCLIFFWDTKAISMGTKANLWVVPRAPRPIFKH